MFFFLFFSEGQRKAHYEECESEKKRNSEKVRQLKKEVKELQIKLSQPPTVSSIFPRHFMIWTLM